MAFFYLEVGRVGVSQWDGRDMALYLGAVWNGWQWGVSKLLVWKACCGNGLEV